MFPDTFSSIIISVLLPLNPVQASECTDKRQTIFLTSDLTYHDQKKSTATLSLKTKPFDSGHNV
jgi:hypothetical protein